MTTRKLIRVNPLCQKLGGVSTTTVWRRVNDGTLPKPTKIGGLTVWDEGEVDERIEAMLAKRDEIDAVIDRAKRTRDEVA